MKCLVTGAAGFIGSNLVDFLLQSNNTVVGYDNLRTGRIEYLDQAKQSDRFTFVLGDVLNKDLLSQSIEGCDIVFHIAANADIRGGIENTFIDLEQNVIATHTVLEAMRAVGCKRIAFASSSAVYGDAAQIPTPENVAMPVQISLYGSSKLSGEGLVSSYCEGFGFEAWVFRFVSVLGDRYTHGHVFDFVKQLRETPEKLRVLGNGLQKKSYMDVGDCVGGIMTAVEHATSRYNVFNLGLDSYCEINQSIAWICERMKVTPQLEYSGGERGWIGDSPFIWLDPAKIFSLGWKPKKSIQEAVIATVDWLNANPSAFIRT